jgi:hypothetical protein
MARPIYWPSNDSYTLNYQGEPQAGVPVKLYTRQSGGTQVTDLVYVGYDGSIGSAVPSGVLISDGYGLLPAFAGPDGGPTTLWGNHGSQGERIALASEPVAGGGGGGAVSSVVGQTGAVTGTQLLADSTVSTALALKAPLASPALTGTPTAPTAAPGTNTTQVASTAFVGAAVTAGPVDGTVTLAKFAPDASAAVGGVTTATKTANYTAAVGETIPVDATSGPLTVTLPAASRARDRVVVKKVDSTVNAVTVSRAGSDVINTSATTIALTLQHQSTVLRSTGAGVWVVEAGDLPYTALQTALTGLYGPGSVTWLQENAAAFAFAFTGTPTYDSATGLPTSAAVRWPDATTGTFTGTIDGASNGYSGYVVTWAGATTKTVTATGITYDANGNAVGPTGLAVS